MSERTQIRWSGEHQRHDVYERNNGNTTSVICETCKVVLERRAAVSFTRPISELLAMESAPTCGRMTKDLDVCMQRTASDETPCWRHRS